MVGLRFELFRVLARGSWVIGANMRCKLFVALQLEVAHHFVERCASGPTRGFEPPATFGTPKTPKTLLFNPHEIPAHGPLCRCASMSSDRMFSTRLLSRGETSSFRSRALPQENRQPVLAWRKVLKVMSEAYTCRFGSSVGHPTYMEKGFVCGNSLILAWFGVKRDRFLVAFRASRCLRVAAVMPM